jgi:hypothetical protein
MRALQTALTITVLAGMVALGGCAGRGGDGLAPTAVPTAGWMPVSPLPTETRTPVPSATPLPTETPIPIETPGPTVLPLVLGPVDIGRSASCAVPRTPEQLALAPAPDTSPDAAAWLLPDTVVFSAEVVGHDTEARTYRLRPSDPAGVSDAVLSYSGSPLPLDAGRTYRFTWRRGPGEAGAPTSTSLTAEDDAGVVFLGASVKAHAGGTDPATADTLLSGAAGGLGVRQMPTLCQTAEVDACGYELRAAPIEVTQGDRRVVVDAGQTGVLDGDPPYRATVFTSHLRRWVSAVPGTGCANVADWTQSWRVERMPTGG